MVNSLSYALKLLLYAHAFYELVFLIVGEHGNKREKYMYMYLLLASKLMYNLLFSVILYHVNIFCIQRITTVDYCVLILCYFSQMFTLLTCIHVYMYFKHSQTS